MTEKSDNSPAYGEVKLPDAPVLVLGGDGGYWLTTDGEMAKTSLDETAARVVSQQPLLVHRLNVARRLGINPFPAFDLLELFAFAFPYSSL